MRKFFFLLPLLPAAVFFNGCKTVRVEGPALKVPPAKPQIAQAKQTLKNKKDAASSLPPVLGGLVKSDSWVIYKDKQQEEFTGNVSYDNGVYQFRSQYALSERALNRFTAKKDVYLKQKENGTVYEAYTDNAVYNYKTQKGNLQANKGKKVRLVYTNPKQETVTAYAKKVSFDLAKKLFILEQDVRVERPTPQGLQTLSAQKATLDQLKNHAVLEGDASLSDSQRTLEADTIVYDGNNNKSYAYGSRPLMHGTSEENTFAIIADTVQADNEGRKIVLDGKVQGWVVSPQLNDSKLNDKF